MKKNAIKKLLSICMIIILTIIPSVSAFAAVEVSEGEGKDIESITIAGKPDYYPYEYYDEKSKTYKGLFPDLMEIVSEKTGIEFEYVYAGPENQQLFQSKTGNADVLTAFIKNDEYIKDYKLNYGTTVITYQNEDGETVEIGIAFTRFIINGYDEKINAALSEISSDEILAILNKYTGNSATAENDKTNSHTIIFIILGVIIIVLAAIVAFFLVKRKKNSNDEKIDKLTGLYNRIGFDSEFEKIASGKNKAIYVFAYIGFDIVRVNSTYGENAAESQLHFAAEELRAVKTGSHDILGRYTGGGFTFLHVSSNDKQTEEWISNILKKLNTFVERYDKEYKPLFRAGVYKIEPGFWDRSTLVSDSQRSYQYAVDQDIPYYIADSNEAAKELIRKHLRARTASAIADDEFKQYFQPVVKASTGEIVGAEALSRWAHPEMGVLSPSRYIEMMEEEGTILELDLLIFEKVCMTLEAWKKEGCDYWISTNFTRITLSSRDFEERITEITGRYDFDHSKCVFEITEDCLENNVDIAAKNVKKSKEMGFRIAIDDLGSGYTFFSDFVNYKIDEVKVDRAILLETEYEKGKALLKGIVDMCKNLEISVLIEGVETNKQLELVRDLGCDMIQGFYFYKPMPQSEFDDLRLQAGANND